MSQMIGRKSGSVWVSRFAAAALALLIAGGEARATGLLNNVPEASGYKLVYEFPIPVSSLGWGTQPVPYTVDVSSSIGTGSFDRVAYYLELVKTTGATQWVYVSMTPFSAAANRLGVPRSYVLHNNLYDTAAPSNATIRSNVSGIVNTNGCNSVNLEFWPSNYGQSNEYGVPGASAATFDFGDGGASATPGHGSMQIHNYAAAQTLFSYSQWGNAASLCNLGIGNCPNPVTGGVDWTFDTSNISTFSIRTLQVLVRPNFAITNLKATNVTDTSVWMNAQVTTFGTNSDVWAFWGDTDRGTNAALWAHSALVGNYSNGVIGVARQLTGLTSGTTNWYTFFVSNAVQTAWASPSTNFVTAAAPAIENGGVVLSGGQGQAVLRGWITAGNTADLYIYWGRNDGGQSSAYENVIKMTDVRQGLVTATITGYCGFNYHYICFVSNSVGSAWASSSRTFTMPNISSGYNYSTGLRASLFQPTADTQVPIDLTGANYFESLARVFTGNKSGTVLAMSEVSGKNIVLTGSASSWNEFGGSPGDHFVAALSGRFFPPVTGTYTFRWSQDDIGWMFMDTGNDGMFDGGDAVGSWAWNGSGSKTLTAGQSYPFMFFSQEFAGSDNLAFWYTPPGGSEVYVNPSAQAGQWCYASSPQSVANITNALVEAGSLTDHSATLKGGLSCQNWAFDVYVCWGRTDGGSAVGNWETNAYVGRCENWNGPVGLAVDGLSAGQTYYYTFFVTNELMGAWASPSQVFVPGAVMIEATDASASESGDTGSFRVTRPAGATGGALTVYYTLGGTAANGTDYAALSGSVTIPDGATSADIAVAPLADSDWQEGGETVTATLATGNYLAGSPSSASVTIHDVGTTADDWFMKLPIRFTGYNRSEALTNFPALVTLDANLSGFSYDQFLSGANGDLRFADESLSRELPYEIERWNTSGQSHVWVQVPRLTNNATIWMLWHRSGLTAPAYTTNGSVWSQGYVIVAHQSETSGMVMDSSPYQNHGVPSNFPPQGVSAVIAGGDQFDGMDDMVTFKTAGRPIDNFAFSAWIKASQNHEIDVETNSATTGTSGQRFAFDAEQVQIYAGAGLSVGTNGLSVYEHSASYMPPLAVYSANIGTNWNYVTVAYSNRLPRIYMNGALVRTGYTSPRPSVYAPYRIGGQGNGYGYFTGLMDETRVSGVTRSANWVWAEYMTMASNSVLTTYGAYQTVGHPDISNLPASGVSGSEATLNGSLSSTGMASTAVAVYWGTTDGGTDAGAWANTNWFATPVAPGVLSQALSDLVPGTVYFFRFAASNAYGTVWAPTTETLMTGEVTLEATDAAAAESPLDAGTVRVSRGVAQDSPLTVYYTLSGTAANGADMSTLNGSVTIPAGAATADIVVTPLFNRNYQTRETDTVTLTLAAGGYVSGSPNAGTVTITNWQPSTALGFDVPRNFLSSTPDPITGSETLSKIGAGQMMFGASSGNTFNGDISVDTDGGILRVGGIPGALAGTGVTLPGMTAANTITVKRGGQFYIDDNGTYSSVGSAPNRLGTEGNRPSVVLNGGALTLNGANFNTTVPQNFGALSLGAGFSTVTANRNAGTPELVFTGVSQAKGSHVNFAGTSLGQYSNAPRVRFTSPPVLTGGGGSAGTTAMSIMTGARFTGDVVTHDAITGVRPLTTVEYNTVANDDINAAGATENVRMSTALTAIPPLNADKTVNSLVINVAAQAYWTPTNKLTLTSGQLISGVQNNQMVISYPGTLTAGTGTSDASLDVTVINNYTYIRSLIADNGGGKVALTKNGGSVLTLDGSVDNTYSGGTYINEGTLNTGGTAGRRFLGNGPARVDAGLLNLQQAGATANASGDDYTAVNGGQIQVATVPYAGDETFNIGAGCVILGSWSTSLGLNSLDRGINAAGTIPNITLAPDAIIAHNTTLTAPLNLTNNTVRNLGTNCDLYYGVVSDQNNANGSITIGKGTAFKGVATDRSDRRWAVGTINVTPGTDEIYLQGMIRPGAAPCQLYLGNWLIAGGTVIAPAGPLTANVLGTLILDDNDSTFGDTSAGKPVTFAIKSGSTVNANKQNAMGIGNGVASIRVEDGGSLQFGMPNAINGNVTVQAGGRLIANNAGGLIGTGAITMNSGSVIEVQSATGLTGSQADTLAASLLPGQIIRLNVGSFGAPADTLDSHVGSKAPIYELYSNNYGAANPLTVGTTVMTLNRDAATGQGGMLVNDWAGRVLSAAADGVLVIGPNGGTIAATSNTTLEVQQRYALGANALTIGATNMLDRIMLPKLGTVYLNTYFGVNTALPGSSITVIPGATLQTIALGNGIPDEPDVTVNGTFLAGGAETLGSLGGSGLVNLQGNTLTVGRNNNASTFSGWLTNSVVSAALIKSGSGRMDITSRQDGYTGVFAINGGVLAFSGDGATTNSGTSAFTLFDNGTLTLDNSTVNKRDRLTGAAPGVTFNGGTFRLVGKDGEASGETIGSAFFSSGTSTIDVDNGSGAGSSTELRFAAAVPGVGTVKFTAANGTLGAAGDNPRVFFDWMDEGVIGYATVGGAPAYYDRETGVRAFTLGEGTEFNGTADQTGVDTKYTSLNNHLALDNARIVNSLWIDSPGAGCAVNLGSSGANSLTLSSGRLSLTGSDDFSITRSGSSSGVLSRDANGTLFFGVGAGRTLSVGVPIANGFGQVEKDGSGTLVLAGANTFAGTLSVNEGTVRYASGGAGDLSTNAVNVWNSGVLDFFGDTDTLGSLTLYSGGVTNSSANGALTVSSLTMGGGSAGSSAYVQSGTGSLKLGGNVTYNVANDPDMATIGGKLDLNGATRTFVVNNSAAPGAAVDLDVTATVIGGAGYGVTKNGLGVMRLSSSNAFDGAVSIGDSCGSLIAAHPQAFGNPTAGRTLTVGSPSSLVFDGSKGDITVPALYTNLFLNGAGDYQIGPIRGEVVNRSGTNTVPCPITLNGGTYLASLGGKLTLAGNITGVQDLTVFGQGDMELGGAIMTGAKVLNKYGTGTLTLSGTGTNTFTSTTTVVAGKLLLAKANGSLPVNAIGLGAVVVNSGGVLQYAAASANPDLIATNAVTINGTGQLDFNGASDIVGPVTIASYGAPSDSTPILNTTGGGNWAVNGLLTVTPVSGYLTRIDTGTGTLTLSNNLLFNASGAGRLQISGNLSLGTITNRYFTINQGLYPDYDVLIDAVISGAPGAGITKDSTVYSWGTATGGILRFTGANTFDGNVTMNDSNKGTLVLANNQALGVPSTNRTLWIGSGCTLALDGGVTLSDPNNRIELVLKGTGDSRLAGVSGTGVAQSGALFSLSGTNTVPCRISLSNATQIASSKRLVLQGMVYGGAYGLTFAGPGETAVSGASGMITNASSITLIANATLSLENTVAANKPDRIINTIPMTLNGGSIRFANDGSAADFAETLGALTVNMGSNTIFASQAAASQTSALVFASINRVSGTVNFVGEGLGVDARNRIFITGLGDGMIGPWATINGTNLALYSSARGVYAGSGTEYGVAALGGTDASVIPDDASASAVINTQGSFGPITVANVWTNRILEVRQATEYASTVRMVQGVTNRTLQTSRISIGEGKASVTIGENSNEGALMALSSGGILTLENLNPSATLSVKSAIPNNGASASSLYKFGAGTVVLSGSNSYAGATMINEGTFEVSGSSTQTLAGVISGNGALVKSGSGKLSLGSDNTYTGLTTIAQGTVVANQNAAFGSTAVGTVIGSGATLDVGSTKAIHQLSLAEPFTVSGKGVNNLGAIVNNSAVEQGNAFGKITLAGDTTFGGISRWDLRASTPVLTMNGYNITKVGANTIMLCTTVVYPNGEGGTGNINFNTGALRLESWNNLNGSAANKLTIGSGVQLSMYNFQNVYPANWTLALATNAWVVGSAGAGSSYNVWSGPVSLTGWAVLAPGSGTSVTFTNVLSGDGAIIKSDVGTVYLTSSTNTYTGATTVSNGTLYAKYPGSLPGYNDGRLTVAGGGTVAVHASDGTFGFTSEQIRDLNLNASFKAVNAILSIDTTSANLTCPYDLPKLMGLTKLGTNALTLARNAVLGNIVSYDGALNLYGNNTCSGGLALVCGKASMTGTNTFIGSGDIYFGSSTLTNGTLTIGPNGRLTCGGNFRLGLASGSGALYLNGGSFSNSAAGGDLNFSFGRETNSYGYFRMTGGRVNAGRFQTGGNAGDVYARGRGLARITGGDLTFTEYILIGRNIGCESALTLDGGTITHATSGSALVLCLSGGHSDINLTGGTLNNANNNVWYQNNTGAGTSMGTGMVNLCAGTLTTAPLQNPNNGQAFLNFGGGTLAASADSTVFVPANMTGVYTFGSYSGFAGGAVIDSNGKAIAIPAVIRNPTGQGVASIAVASTGAGYIGEPYVSIEGGSGTGATAVANLVDDGTGRGTFSVGSVTVTCPGVGYAAMPTVLFKGGGFNIVTAQVGTVTLADNVGGGLTKIGTGTLTLSAANTYTGTTTVAAGTLKLGTATALMTNSPIVLAGGMLDLGGYTITNAISGSGSVSNGTFSTTLSPNGPGVLGTNTLALGSAAVIKGTYEADVTANGRCDRLNIQGNIDLSKLDLQIVNANLLDRTKVYTILSCTGTLTGRLTIKNIGLDSRWHVVNRPDGSVQLRFTNGTFMFMR